MYLANYVPGTLPDAKDSKMKDTGPKLKDFMESLGRPTGGKLGLNATVGGHKASQERDTQPTCLCGVRDGSLEDMRSKQNPQR